MYVVSWEPKRGAGGGHQLVLERQKAETISLKLASSMPEAEIRIVSATEHAAAAVAERQEQRGRRPRVRR